MVTAPVQSDPQPNQSKRYTRSLISVQQILDVGSIFALQADLHNYVVVVEPQFALEIAGDDEVPRLDGPAVATALIKVFPQMKIVLMSGYSESMNTELDLLLPDAEFLEKPLRMSELAETAKRLLASASNSS